ARAHRRPPGAARPPGLGKRGGERAVDQPIAPFARGRLPDVDRSGPSGGSAMRLHTRRVRAIVRKEMSEYRRNTNIIFAIAILPLIFFIHPLIQVFPLPTSASVPLRHEHVLLYMLAIPVLVPVTLGAYSIVGERLQGTLEPVLGTPIRRDELLLGKALAAFLPSVCVAYTVFAIFVAAVELFARPGVASALIQG